MLRQIHLGEFQLLPIVYHLSGTVGLYIAVDMRMSVYQLIAQCIDHIAYIETPLFRPHARIEDDVEHSGRKPLSLYKKYTLINKIDL